MGSLDFIDAYRLMTATNHALTGAIIGLSLSNPYLALPLAFLSHFALDALPHYDSDHCDVRYLRSKKFLRFLSIDISLCITLVILLTVLHPISWQLSIACAFVATSPDLMWLPNYLKTLKGAPNKPIGSLGRIHAKIQQFERPWGIWVEIVWFIITLSFLLERVK